MSRDARWDAEELRRRFGDRIAVGEGCELPRDTVIEIGEGALLAFGDRVSVRRGAVFEVSDGAAAVFGDDVTVGENVAVFVMAGLWVGDGCGISNMVDIHDHNHRPRSLEHTPDGEWTPWASGFVAAPIVLEAGSILSNKCSVTAGVRVGYNTLVGANSVVAKSLPPNAVAAGSPAAVIQTFDGTPPADYERPELRLGFFGTSIMEHMEGYAARLFQQWNLPSAGDSVVVEGFRPRGYVHRLSLDIQAAYPHLRVAVDNRGEGGANSRDVLAAVQAAVKAGERYDVSVFGCGLNDVWRAFQGRMDDAVGIDEYADNCAAALRALSSVSRRTVLVTETPFGFPDAAAMNEELRRYAAAAMRVAGEIGVDVVDVYPEFAQVARTLRAGPEDSAQHQSIWGDGIHLSELGDALMARRLGAHLTDSGALAALERYDRVERSEARVRYAALTEGWRSRVSQRRQQRDRQLSSAAGA